MATTLDSQHPKYLPINWRRTFPLIVTHLGALAAFWTFSWSALVITATLFACTGLGVTVGLHRLLTHRSFKTSKTVEAILATLGALAFQGGIIEWVTLHRIHHQNSDTQKDPHTPKWNFLFGYFLWVLIDDHRPLNFEMRAKYTPDLIQSPFLSWLDKNSICLQLSLAFVLFSAGLITDGLFLALSWVVWGIFVRIVMVQHVTWLVNSASHRFGYRNFENNDNSSNCWWVAFLTFGEGWHNNHHAQPSSANFGARRLEFDSGYLVLKVLAKLGLVWEIKNGFAKSKKASWEKE